MYVVTRRATILIADFFGTVKERGIAAYVRDIEAVANPVADTVSLRAPHWVRRLPQGVQNLLMVLHEQLVVPFHALRLKPDLIVFPYNSSSFLLSLSRRTVLVIHDLIPYRAGHRGSGLAFAYVACSARWHARLGRRIVAVSPFTARTLTALPRFSGSEIITIPNCFATMPVLNHAAEPRPRVTLISGTGPNKAFAQALELMADVASSPHFAGVAFDVVGFGMEHGRATDLIEQARAAGLTLPPITVHPLLPRIELDALIAANAVLWAHSLAEGFGRAVVEGRATGRPVVMSRLPVFRPLYDDYTFAYANGDSAGFRSALTRALDAASVVRPYRLVEELRREAVAGVKELLGK
ncbi:glycosyltransferase [Sphingomonas sp. 2378]|uniref:glycosyltransferase n=1 Tax=Sphingomonas sp. 2378 TaxID=1219748 RepID=UPI00311ABA42